MKFMMLMIPSVYQNGKEIKEDFAPSADDVAKMMKFNEELTKAGALIELDGLQPPSKGARITYAGGKPVVTDGPFAETREQLGGYYLIDADDLDDAVSIAARVPPVKWGTVEIRPVVELPDVAEN